MAKYITAQRKALLEYFNNHTDEPVTARQIAQELSNSGISLSAVYRNLAELEAENKVRRIISQNNREACYQYSAAEECRGCLHLACKRCGKVMHMEQSNAELLIKSVAQHDNFTVDRTETVIYGICTDCKN